MLVTAANIPVASFSNVRDVSTKLVKHLGMEVVLRISRHFEVLKPTERGDQITAVEAVAISFSAAGSAGAVCCWVELGGVDVISFL